MADDTEKPRRLSTGWFLPLLGPVVTVLALGATMALGFGAQGQKIVDLTEKVDKLYDVLIYPHVNQGRNP